MKSFDAYEDLNYITEYSNIWKRDEKYIHKYSNDIVNNDYDIQFCIIGIDSLVMNMDKVKELYEIC